MNTEVLLRVVYSVLQRVANIVELGMVCSISLISCLFRFLCLLEFIAALYFTTVDKYSLAILGATLSKSYPPSLNPPPYPLFLHRTPLKVFLAADILDSCKQYTTRHCILCNATSYSQILVIITTRHLIAPFMPFYAYIYICNISNYRFFVTYESLWRLSRNTDDSTITKRKPLR